MLSCFMLFYVQLCSITLNYFKLLNVSYSLCYDCLQLFIQHQTPPQTAVPTCRARRGSAKGRVPGLPHQQPLQNPLQNPLPSSVSTTGNVGMGNGWGGILGELGRLCLQESRLRGIPGTAISPCREVQRGRSRAAPSGAQQLNQRHWATHWGTAVVAARQECSSASLVVYITITADSARPGCLAVGR